MALTRRGQAAGEQGPRQRLAEPWVENPTQRSYAAAARTGMTVTPTAPQAAGTRAIGPPGRHRLKEPVVGAWGERNRRTADRNARWIVAPGRAGGSRQQTQEVRKKKKK